MKALVISGGGSKGAFAGGVAEYLVKEQKKEYDLYLGSSTGSLLISHLALGKIEALKKLYTQVNQRSIFSNNPFFVKNRHGEEVVTINHLNVMWNFIRRRKTFGESKNLRKLIRESVSENDCQTLKNTSKEVVVAVSNLTTNQIEYKTLRECSYDDFCDWIWASCNYVPFMSLLVKDNCEYADGGFGCLVPVREAIQRGATEIDVIILDTEVQQLNRMPSKNPFSLLSNVFDFLLEHVKKHNLTIGKLAAKNKDVKLNMYYTPTVLTTNSLIFDQKKMTQWWEDGYAYMRDKYDAKMTPMKYDR
jgi:predicted patatin/cPLA2 family phospholipase